MGIKHFFYWFKEQFPELIYSLKRNQVVSDVDVVIDNLMLDMNGIIHAAAKKIYEYDDGSKQQIRLLVRPGCPLKQPQRTKPKEAVYEEVCLNVEKLIAICKPTKRLILCIDGVAPLSKQNQQRQRRFRSAMEAAESGTASQFDKNSITPGTEFLDGLSRYMDWYIRKRISECDIWQNFTVIFSDEKVPQEGEHKIANFVRKFGPANESYCINGLDADLIMLALSTHKEKFYIIREDMYNSNNDYFLVDIGTIRGKFIEMLRWTSPNHVFNPIRAINDFVFLGFAVGNDFLPHIPSIEIIQQGLELIIDTYKQIGSEYGHITFTNIEKNIRFNPAIFGKFLNLIGEHEQENYENKRNSKIRFLPDPTLDKCSRKNSMDKWEVDIEKYKELYDEESFPGANMEQVSHEYFRGLDWVLAYYTKGVPSWKWYYPYHYAPFASTLARYATSYRRPIMVLSTPLTPFQQLLSVLPPQSAKLLPQPLGNLLLTPPLNKYCPETVKIDVRGKKQLWEGLTLIGFMPQEEMKREYTKMLAKVSLRELERDKANNSYIYEYSPAFPSVFKSQYGDINNCIVVLSQIDL